MNGKCNLCGQLGVLSYEHTPPKAAFNSHKQTVYSGYQLIKHIISGNLPWNVSSLHGKQLQRGTGQYSLCGQCNSVTGSKYAPALIDFYEQSLNEVVAQMKKEGKIIIQFKKIYPLRIIKQVICMFLSTNSPNFAEENIQLRQMLLDINLKEVLQKFSISCYINTGMVLKSTGLTVKINPSTGIVRSVSEITTIPFGFVLEIDGPKDDLLTDISFFSRDYGYDDKVDLELTFPLLPSNTIYPLDYRAASDIQNLRKVN